uniref:Oxidoreductase n=1 Tax=Caenorhabditis tropicalis TaxID=1561998 RepID=A0A1I7U6E9_9PELO
MRLFPRTVFTIALNFDDPSQTKRIFQAFGIQHCEFLSFNGENKISKEQVLGILKKTEIELWATFYVDLEPGFPYENGLSLPRRINFHRGQATREMIFQLGSRVIVAGGCKLSKITPN